MELDVTLKYWDRPLQLPLQLLKAPFLSDEQGAPARYPDIESG